MMIFIKNFYFQNLECLKSQQFKKTMNLLLQFKITYVCLSQHLIQYLENKIYSIKNRLWIMREEPNPIAIQSINDDPFQDHEPGMPPDIARYDHQLKEQRQMRRNIQRVKTSVQKLQQIPLCKLDIGILQSLGNQFSDMCTKISYVLVPRTDATSYRLRNWDLWGPFFMLILFAFFIDNTSQLLFIFFSIIIGSFIVTFNVVALGGRVSYFQSVSILNYCMFPIFMSLHLDQLLKFFQIKSRVVDFVIIAVAVIWSMISVYVFIGVNVPENRKVVASIPAFLYYFFIGILLSFK